ncbi:carboxypeptidase-like regulatory domain-containing protein [Marinitoga lauensis]|uniref:carboxypeptidase-like regulatory domain-containing protein n=1 Tax=Marinitoga lauensis TaxID=2201189 RepID=UPI0010122F17|nr:carboxypeptidase-like regulatory domain-containing protein [Marinitoga lauensis]
MKKYIYVISLSIITIFIFFSCQKIDPLLGNSNISGLTKLSNTINYENIKISIEGLEAAGEGFSPIDTIATLGDTLSDKNGNFLLENIPAGNYIIKAEKEGYFPTKQFIEVSDNSEIELSEPLILYPLEDYGTLKEM